MRRVYMAFPMTMPNNTVSPMKALASWLRRNKKYRVFEPHYELFPEDLASGALERLDSSFLVIADVSQASHGVGFEMGYAVSKGKKVIAVAQDCCRNQISRFISTLLPDIIYFTGTDDLVAKVSDRLSNRRSS